MSRNPTKRGARARRAPAAPPAGKSTKQRLLLGTIAAVLLLGGSRAVIMLRHARPAAEAPVRIASADRAAAMSVMDAGREAARLYRANRSYESLPYYRRVAPEMAPGRLDFRLEFATALQTASLQAPGQSEERVRLMLESLDQLGLTERAMQRPGDRARVIVARAFFLRVWGFPADALAELRRALATDPTYPELAATVRRFEREVQEPTLPLDERGGPSLTY
jgi:hypothetical protein